jgi:hypothetical protein
MIRGGACGGKTLTRPSATLTRRERVKTGLLRHSRRGYRALFEVM